MPRLAAVLLALLAVGSAFAEESLDAAQRAQRFSETIRPFFTPTATDRATLSPDGKHVAYTLHHGDTAYVMMINVDDPGVKIPIAVSEDREGPAFARNKIRGRVVFLDWAAGRRLVFSSDLGEIFAIDADGRNLKKFADLEDLSVF
ncbi:MAG TPA: hypothetical protein VHN55_03335, partial [Sphingomicrobium sp.]|nr:hypothetical protein [Sphingomicrobium sp.]